MKARIFLALSGLWGCGGSQAEPQAQPTQLQCTIDGQQEMRVMRDCSTDLSYQERDLSARVEAFGVSVGGETNPQFRPVKNSVNLLLEQQRGMCRDWNACALSRPEYVQRSEWLTSQFTTLQQLLDAASPETMNDPGSRERVMQQILDWAQRAQELRVTERIETQRNDIAQQQVEVAAQANVIESDRTAIEGQTAVAETQQAGAQARIASASEEQARLLADQAAAQRRALADQQAAAARGNSALQAQLQLQIGQQERDLGELRAFLTLLGRVRDGSEGASEGKAPRICADRATRSKLAELHTSGASVGGDARSVADRLDDVCNRFQKWTAPDDVGRRSIQGFFNHLKQIDGWMNDKIRCGNMTDAAERRRCENTFGAQGASDEADARRALEVTASLRREMAGVEDGRRPFPCRSQTWVRIAAMQWTMSVARAQMPGLPSSANSVCSVLGVDDEHLADATRQLVGRLDSAESGTRQRIRFTEDSLTRTRAMVH